MGRLKSINDVVNANLCISCGACASAAPAGAIQMKMNEGRGLYVPQLCDTTSDLAQGPAFDVCPGKGVALDAMARDLFGETSCRRYELGRYRRFIAAHATDPRIREHASSGGVMTALAAFLLETGAVRGVTASRFVYGDPGPRTESFVARTLEDLISAQGSKYCPTTTNALIQQCCQEEGPFLFSGTPCHVAGLRLAQVGDPRLKEIFPLTMANFCAGYRDYRHLDGMLRYDQVDPQDVTSFRFRGGGQPGTLKAETKDGRTIRAPYPDYDGRTQITKQKRCVYCIDATGELADFGCGDAWLDRLLETGEPWSIILARSERGAQILQEMVAQGKLDATEVTEEEICFSQRQNLASKKFRQRKRRALSHLFGISMPEWDSDLVNEGTYAGELRTLFGKTWLGLKWRQLKKKLKGDV